jgi:hypothetical protein
MEKFSYFIETINIIKYKKTRRPKIKIHIKLQVNNIYFFIYLSIFIIRN